MKTKHIVTGTIITAAVGGCFNFNGPVTAKVTDSISGTINATSSTVIAPTTTPSVGPTSAPTIAPTIEPAEIYVTPNKMYRGAMGSMDRNLFIDGAINNPGARELTIALNEFPRSPNADPLLATLDRVILGILGRAFEISRSNGSLKFDPKKDTFVLPGKTSARFTIGATGAFAQSSSVLEALHEKYVGFIADENSFLIVGGGAVHITPFEGKKQYCDRDDCKP